MVGCPSRACQQLLWAAQRVCSAGWKSQPPGPVCLPAVSICSSPLPPTPLPLLPAAGPQHDWPVGLRDRHKQAPSLCSKAALLFVFQLSFPLHRSRFDLPIGSAVCHVVPAV